jgi:hypothetical protein
MCVPELSFYQQFMLKLDECLNRAKFSSFVLVINVGPHLLAHFASIFQLGSAIHHVNAASG